MSNKTQLSNNNTKLASLIHELQGKAAGGGASVETCTVELDGVIASYRPYYYSYTYLDDSGNIASAAVAKNSGVSVTLNNVVCGSVVTVYWYSWFAGVNMEATNITTLTHEITSFHAFKVVAPAGGVSAVKYKSGSDGSND